MSAHAQLREEVHLIFLKNHIGAGFELPFLFVKHAQHRGAGDMEMHTLPGFAFRADYTYNFNPHFGITAGGRIGLKIFGYEARAEGRDFNLPKTLSRSFVEMIPFFAIPLFIHPRLFAGKRHFLEAAGGATVTFFAPASPVNTMNWRDNKTAETVFILETQYAGRPQITFHGALTWGMALNNMNLLKAGLGFDYGRRTAFEGKYGFHKDDVLIGSGKIISTLNCIALEFSYVFTRAAGIRKS